MYADTRAEWLIAAQASFQHSLTIVTIYTNLGDDGVLHGLSETESEIVITSHELLPKFRHILDAHKDRIKTIIFMDHPTKSTDTAGFREDVQLLSFWNVVSLGMKSKFNNNEMNLTQPVKPSAEKPAIIMYTSGR